MRLLQTLFIIYLFLFSNYLFAQEIVLSSKNKQAIFIELFTSQGCSSCPSAEEYINKFITNEKLWDKYIPIVFHVDYWNYIGWKDVFAQAEFSARQYRYAKLKYVRTVYTPAFIVNGRVWRKGFLNSYPQVKGLDKGLLTVKVAGDKIEASYKSEISNADDLKMNLAILGMGMLVNITAGENEGRKAKHNFVVLAYTGKHSADKYWQLSMPKLKQHIAAKRYAVVAWVSSMNDPAPLQAVAGWLKREN